MQVVADTSVFNYLILLDQLALLPTLYGRIITPHVVVEVELPHPRSPAPVRAWAQQHLPAIPAWLELRAPTRTPEAGSCPGSLRVIPRTFPTRYNAPLSHLCEGAWP